MEDLTGGLDLRRTPTQLGPSRARDLVNFGLSEAGALTVRPQWTQFSTASLGAGRIQGGQRVYLSSYAFTLLAHGGKVYQDTSASEVYSTINSTAQVFFPHDRDLVTVMDGTTSAMRKSSNGSSWVRFGIEPPGSASTLSSAADGNLLANKYEVSWTYRNASTAFDPVHESNASTVSTYTMTSTGRLEVEVRGSTDPQVGLIRAYARNITAGETVRRLASTVANDVTGSTVRLVITDSNWSLAVPEPTDRDVPPPLAFAVFWKNRWWGKHATIGNRLHFTQVFQAQSWPGTFFIDIPFERGDSITAIQPVGDTLILFGNSGIHLIIGQTSLDFEVRPAIAAQDGAVGARAVAKIETGVAHAGLTGIYLFDGASDRLLNFDLEPGWRDAMVNGAQPDVLRTPLVYHALRKELRVAVTRRYPSTAAGEWILDLNRTTQDEQEAWAPTDRSIGGYIHWNGAESDPATYGRLQSWNTTSGIVNDESTGTTANSGNVAASYAGPAFSLGLNRSRWIDVHGEYEPHAGDLSMEVEIDNVSVGSFGIDIGAAGAVYGMATYGTATYGAAGRRKFHQLLPLEADGRTAVVKFNYTGQEAFRLYTYALGLVPEPAIRHLGT